ncbi:MAG: cell division protein ZapA [Pseudomonadales bacterium]|jgi:cell division protein ZapA
MSNKQTTVSVKILDKEYQVACPEEEVEALTAAARYLDRQMSEIRDSGKVFGLDRIAVMAALNIANELLTKRGEVQEVSGHMAERIHRLTERVANALAEQKQLNL